MKTPACRGIVDVDDAITKVKRMIAPALSSTPEIEGTTWLPDRGWTPAGELPQLEDAIPLAEVERQQWMIQHDLSEGQDPGPNGLGH